MYVFIVVTREETVFTRTFLTHSPLQEKCGKYGNQIIQQGDSSFKNTGQI
jgi:hypothetical protein